MVEYRPRTLEYHFERADKQFPVLLVTGARQVGKTTFVQHVRDDSRTYLTLDDPTLRSLAKAEPALFLQRFPPPLLVDEFQYAPELLPYIKMAADRIRNPGLFWLTGSQPFQVMKGVSESLAGRVGIVNLLGFSRRELIGKSNQAEPFLSTPTAVSRQLKEGGTLSLKTLYRNNPIDPVNPIDEFLVFPKSFFALNPPRAPFPCSLPCTVRPFFISTGSTVKYGRPPAKFF
jgi:hypothetical protein